MTSRLATHSWPVRRSLAAREPFATHGALHAVEGGVFDTGRLPEPYRAAYLDAWSDARITYTVLSYRTPIAWVLQDAEVVIPPVKYSPTTSGHQGLMYALEQRPGDVPGDTTRRRSQAPAQAAGAQSRPTPREPTRPGAGAPC